MSDQKKPNELYLTRYFDADLQTVWESWTHLEEISQWWGPRGFSITTESRQLRPGGKWIYTMHGPDGKDYPNIATYLDIEEGRKIVYDHGATPNTPPLFRVTVLFSENNGKTKMQMTMALDSEKAAREIKQLIKEAGGEATWDRLAEHVEKKVNNHELFVINRSFDVDVKTMFELWTNSEHFPKWLPPAGATMTIVSGEIEEGKCIFYEMPFGPITMHGKVHYQKISPTGLQYIQHFCTENGELTTHPLASTWPKFMKTQVTLMEESVNTTLVTVKWQPIHEITDVELDTFVQGRTGMTQGWTGSFDKLEEYLKSAEHLT